MSQDNGAIAPPALVPQQPLPGFQSPQGNGGGSLRLQDVLGIAAPLALGYIGSRNPAAARGIVTGMGVMGGIQNMQERAEQIRREKRQNDLAYAQAMGTVQGVDKLDAQVHGMDPSTRLSAVPGIQGPTGAETGGAPLDATDRGPDQLTYGRLKSLVDSAKAQVGMSDYAGAQKSALAAIGLMGAPTPQQLNQVSLKPGSKLEGETAAGKMTVEAPVPSYAERNFGKIVAPQGMTIGGQDVSGKNLVTAVDKTTGNQIIMGLAPEDKPTGAAADVAAYKNDPKAFAAMETARRGPQLETAQGKQLDTSFGWASKQIDDLSKPINDKLGKLSDLQDMLNQRTPQSDALIAPKLLTVMTGGQGSGLRMNEAEIARVVGGRSNWESIKAAMNKWQLDPSQALSITPAQRGQIQTLVDTMSDKLNAKRRILRDASRSLLDATDKNQHRMIVQDANDKLDAIDTGGAQSGNAGTQSDADKRLLAKVGIGQ